MSMMSQMGMQDDEGQEQGNDVQAKLDVLQEIKDLMDQRLGDSMKPKDPSIEDLSMKGPESELGEASESPEFEAGEKEGSMEGPEDDSGLSDEDKDKLKMMYSGLK